MKEMKKILLFLFYGNVTTEFKECKALYVNKPPLVLTFVQKEINEL